MVSIDTITVRGSGRHHYRLCSDNLMVFGRLVRLRRRLGDACQCQCITRAHGVQDLRAETQQRDIEAGLDTGLAPAAAA